MLFTALRGTAHSLCRSLTAIDHCGACYQTKRGSVQHEKNRMQRRQLFGLSLNSKTKAAAGRLKMWAAARSSRSVRRQASAPPAYLVAVMALLGVGPTATAATAVEAGVAASSSGRAGAPVRTELSDGVTTAAAPGSELADGVTTAADSLEGLPQLVAGVYSDKTEVVYAAMHGIRKLASFGDGIAVDQIIASGVLPRCVQLLRKEGSRVIQFEAAWTLGSVGSGTEQQTQRVLELGALPELVKLLQPPPRGLAGDGRVGSWEYLQRFRCGQSLGGGGDRRWSTTATAPAACAAALRAAAGGVGPAGPAHGVVRCWAARPGTPEGAARSPAKALAGARVRHWRGRRGDHVEAFFGYRWLAMYGLISGSDSWLGAHVRGR